jgi:hypothetical protein
MFSNPFYHSLLKKYIIVFGTTFNNITINRVDENDQVLERFKVPLAYGPREKHLARVENNPDGLKPTAVRLPRMAFEITSISYAANRKLPTINKLSNTVGDNQFKTYMSVPYDITFQLSIMSKTMDDATRVVEQILPYFTPEFTISAKMIPELDDITDIPIVLNSLTLEDSYDTDFDSRRVITFNLEFTMKVSFWGPVLPAKRIKFMDINFVNNNINEKFSQVTIQPGLTANGEPTTDKTQTIPFTDIEIDDNWDYIIEIE